MPPLPTNPNALRCAICGEPGNLATWRGVPVHGPCLSAQEASAPLREITACLPAVFPGRRYASGGVRLSCGHMRPVRGTGCIERSQLACFLCGFDAAVSRPVQAAS